MSHRNPLNVIFMTKLV